MLYKIIFMMMNVDNKYICWSWKYKPFQGIFTLCEVTLQKNNKNNNYIYIIMLTISYILMFDVCIICTSRILKGLKMAPE